MSTIANSTFLDLVAWQVNGAQTPEEAYGIRKVVASPTDASFNVALVLPRANDPTALLESDWATRQQTLAQLNAAGTLWTTYGADQQLYNQVSQDLTSAQIPILGAADGYVSSAASRTIWVSLNAAQFNSLFGTPILGNAETAANSSLLWWDGSLSLPSQWNISGIWIDWGWGVSASTYATGTFAPQQGPQSVGSTAATGTNLYPQQIASLYNFPLNGTVATGAVGVIEPGVGSSLLSGGDLATFNADLQAYRSVAGVSGTGVVYTQNLAGQSYESQGVGERTLDVSVVGTVVPNSDQYLYVGSGDLNGAKSTYFTAYQSAFWQLPDTLSNLSLPAVVTSSWMEFASEAPGSPFYEAYRQLFIDAALQNQSVFLCTGDQGSNGYIANGAANVVASSASAFVVTVGGTSLSVLGAAQTDSSLTTLLAQAQSGDPVVLWALAAAGMTSLPQNMAASDVLVEAVWNDLRVSGKHIIQGYDDFPAAVGGVDVSQPTPWYQEAYGLTPTTSDPRAMVGRGVPDVSANAGGNLFYTVPDPNMQSGPGDLENWMGTSAATPLWASLYTQFNAIFADQNLPNLGFSNDLLYISAVIAPGSFNDITLGNNITSYLVGGDYRNTYYGTEITPTGYGYSAGAGYDLVSGLGSPNGTLLARSLTAIAHAQMYFDTPEVLGATTSGGWAATVSESLLFQPILSSAAHVDLTLGGVTYGSDAHASASFAWSSQFAQQVLQSDFSAQLVTLFDGQSQATPFQATVQAGATLHVGVNGAATTAPQATLSSPYGFVDFMSGTDAVEVARPVAVAETANGANDQDAVVRLRQAGTLDLHVLFFKVDDYSGSISGWAPGQVGYDGAMQAHAYQTTTGSTWIDGPGFGAYGQTELAHVNAGDLVAMALFANGQTYYAFAGANADGATHLWNYGLNTFGWEDLYGGGDRDYNDLVVQLDFTSTAGHGYLV